MIRNYLEIAQRAETGPKVEKANWDFDYIVEMTREVVDKYQLSWDADTLTPDDPDLADRVFNAGRDLIIKTGVYSLTHGRVIQLDASEVDEGIRAMRKDLDARIASLQRLRENLDRCIGCGCLSLRRCALYNPEDRAAKLGAGARYLMGDKPQLEE